MNDADLHGYVDGRLADERRQAVEAWLATHPDEAARVAAYRALAEQWRAAYAPLLSEPVPAQLLSALQTAPRRAMRNAAAAGAFALLVLALWLFIDRAEAPSGAAAEMVRRAAVAHAVYAAEVEHPVEVRSEGRAPLLAWLSERLNMSVQAPDLAAAGLSFMGGRLLPGDKAAAALLMYEGVNGQRVTLYWGPEYRQQEETGLQFALRPPATRVYYWLDDECGYAVASTDLSREDLLRVAMLAHEQLEK